MLTLRGASPPMPVDFQLCAEQIRLALKLDPNNPHFLRRMREALYSAGDRPGYVEATRQLARLEPKDTVLQLAVISANISEIQSVEERLAAYQRLLGPAGAEIDASVRSRLAFDGALLADEQGDMDRFVSLLTAATQLDPTNKQAAARAADYYLSREDDPEGRIEVLANVVLADPLDPSAHLNLAREFLRHGATRAGARFLDHHASLTGMQGQREEEGTLLRRYALQWLHDGGATVLEELAEVESIRRYAIEQRRKALEEAGEDPLKAGAFRPDPLAERIKIIVASGEGEDEAALQAMQSIEGLIRQSIQAAQEQMEGENPPPAAQIEEGITEMLVESLYLRLWSGLQLDKAQGTIEQLEQMRGARRVRPESIQRFMGLLAARRGQRELAEELLRPQADLDPAAMLGLGIAAETVDDRRAAIQAYARVALNEPGTMMGVWAQRRVERVLGKPLTPTEAAQRMERLAQSLPQTIDRMVRGPQSFLTLETEMLSRELDPLGRVLLRVKVRNVGPIPVAVGERSPVRSSALLIPNVRIGGTRVMESMEPEVVSLNRRLRLMPRESIDAVVWADQGQTGALLDIDAGFPVSLRWRTILGLDIDQSGQYADGPTSMDHESDMATRGRIPALGDTPEDAALAIEVSEPGETLLKSLLMARSLMLTTLGVESPDAAEVRQNICDAIATRYETMTTAERAFTLVILPPPANMPETGVVDEAAAGDTDPVLLALRLRRIPDPNDAMYATAMELDDPDIRLLARLLQARLERQIRFSSQNAGAPEGQ